MNKYHCIIGVLIALLLILGVCFVRTEMEVREFRVQMEKMEKWNMCTRDELEEERERAKKLNERLDAQMKQEQEWLAQLNREREKRSKAQPMTPP